MVIELIMASNLMNCFSASAICLSEIAAIPEHPQEIVTTVMTKLCIHICEVHFASEIKEEFAYILKKLVCFFTFILLCVDQFVVYHREIFYLVPTYAIFMLSKFTRDLKSFSILL